MATAEQPITRTELREELRHYASKADLSDLKADLTVRMIAIQFGGYVVVAAIVSAVVAILKLA